MVLTSEQKVAYILKPQNREIRSYREKHRELNMFATGLGVDEYITQIQGLETESKVALRRHFARSTKDVVNKILRPTDKVYSAKGGSFELDMKNEIQQEEFLLSLNNIAEGMSKRKWLETYCLSAYHIDPNAIVFVERPTPEMKRTRPYPTFISITHIHDYLTNGQMLEYVIFEPELRVNRYNQLVKVYRIVDDVMDGLYYVNQEKLVPYGTDAEMVNTLDYVPAFVISNLVDQNSQGKYSQLEPITELLGEYLQDTSIKSIYKFLHGYPFFYRFIPDCQACKGKGYIENDEGSVNCTTCKGSGKNTRKDVSDSFDMTLPTDRDDAIIDVSKSPAGYVEPSVDSWQQMTNEQQFMTDIMVRSFWGTSLDDRYDRETAQGRLIDTQPIAEKLNKYADWAEQIDKMLTDIIGKMTYRSNYLDSYVFYGRRFLIESADQVWSKLIDARLKGAPESSLTQILLQYYQSEYQNDVVMLNKVTKLLSIEPYPFYKLGELGAGATESQKQRKLAFSSWSRSGLDYTKTLEVLQAEFDTYASINIELAPVEPIAVASFSNTSNN